MKMLGGRCNLTAVGKFVYSKIPAAVFICRGAGSIRPKRQKRQKDKRKQKTKRRNLL